MFLFYLEPYCFIFLQIKKHVFFVFCFFLFFVLKTKPDYQMVRS